MRRIAIIVFLLALVAAGGGLLWRRGPIDSDAGIVGVSFSAPTLIDVDLRGRVDMVRVLTETGIALATAYTHGAARITVPVSWQPGARYRIEADSGVALDTQAPEQPDDLVVRLHMPLGQAPFTFRFSKPFPARSAHDLTLPAAPGESVDILLELERLTDTGGPFTFSVDMTGADGAFDPAWRDAPITLDHQFQKILLATHADFADTAPEGGFHIAIRSDNAVFDFPVALVQGGLKEDDIEVVGWRIPTDIQGRQESGRPVDQIAMPNPVWQRFASWFGIKPQAVDADLAFTHQAVDIANRSDHPIALLVSTGVVHPATGAPTPWFDAPTWEAGGGMRQILATVQAKPGETVSCVLPVHVMPTTPAGQYTRRVTIMPLGSDRVLATQDAPLGIVRTKPFFSMWAAFVTLASLTWLVGVLVFYRRLVRGLGVRALVLLSLLGSLQFCLSFLGGWVSTILAAILGPFNCLVGGFVTEVLTYIIIATILYQVPRVGAMTLAGLVSYFMGAILFGTFGLTDFLFVGSAIAFRETLLFVFGVTHVGPGPERAPRVLPMMLALGLADAASLFTGLALFSVLYRLFYANWYIALNVGVTGFLYTAIGVYLGRSLGLGLRRVRA